MKILKILTLIVFSLSLVIALVLLAIDVGAYNCTAGNFSYCSNTQTDLNFLIEPGTFRIGTQDYTNYNFTCNACNTTPSFNDCNQYYGITNVTNFCGITKTLDSGQHYLFNSGACDLDFECEESDIDLSELIKNQSFTKNFNLLRANDTLTVTYDGIQKSFPIDLETFSYEVEYKIYCDAVVPDYATGNLSFDQCLQYSDYFVDSTSVSDLFRTLGITQYNMVNQTSNIISDLRRCNEEVYDLKSTDINYESQFNRCSDDLSECEEKKNTGNIIKWIYAIGFWVLLLLSTVLGVMVLKTTLTNLKGDD